MPRVTHYYEGKYVKPILLHETFFEWYTISNLNFRVPPAPLQTFLLFFLDEYSV